LKKDEKKAGKIEKGFNTRIEGRQLGKIFKSVVDQAHRKYI
jgi:hypothetical protein